FLRQMGWEQFGMIHFEDNAEHQKLHVGHGFLALFDPGDVVRAAMPTAFSQLGRKLGGRPSPVRADFTDSWANQILFTHKRRVLWSAIGGKGVFDSGCIKTKRVPSRRSVEQGASL